MSLPVAQELRNKRHALKRAQRTLARVRLEPHPGLDNMMVELRKDEAVEVVDYIRTLESRSASNVEFLQKLGQLARFLK